MEHDAVEDGEVPSPRQGMEMLREFRALQTITLDPSTPQGARTAATQEAFARLGNYGLLMAAAAVASRWQRVRGMVPGAAGRHQPAEFPRGELKRMVDGAADPALVEQCLDVAEALVDDPFGGDEAFDALTRSGDRGLTAFTLFILWSVLLADIVVDFHPMFPTRQQLLQHEALESEIDPL